MIWCHAASLGYKDLTVTHWSSIFCRYTSIFWEIHFRHNNPLSTFINFYSKQNITLTKHSISCSTEHTVTRNIFQGRLCASPTVTTSGDHTDAPIGKYLEQLWHKPLNCKQQRAPTATLKYIFLLQLHLIFYYITTYKKNFLYIVSFITLFLFKRWWWWIK